MMIHQLFELQAGRTPDVVALAMSRSTPWPPPSFPTALDRVTYQELNRQANQLAHLLRALGVGPEEPVGVCLEASIERVVALLGVLKAGGAYVPLDPTYPASRLAFMLADSRASVLLTRAELVSSLPAPTIKTIRLDADRALIGQYSSDNPGYPVAPDHPAYVIYTSGSTGQPKGVVGLHRGAVNRFQWMWRAYPFEPGEVCCQKTALSFIDSVWEIFGPLLQGVPAVIMPDAIARDALRLVQALAEAQVTRLVLVPSLLQAILDAYPDLQSRLPRLKYWISSGEALSASLVREFYRRMPAGILLNLYGSSEVAADATCFDTSREEWSTTAPIGRPIDNMQAYVLDAQLRPVPVGAPGELYIGGAGLSRGYLHRPDLTAERFIPNPFSAEPGSRLYRTGDLARYRADGHLEFLGRADYQVKIRGFRVELGEIEAALASHPAVREAVVLAREDLPGDKRLVAYIVPRAAAPADTPPPGEARPELPSQLRRFLAGKLPDYMAPATFVLLEALPLTPNGKINRLALPAPEPARAAAPAAAPRTPTEEQLAALWAEVLGLEQVGIDDDFIELGGHSLLATQLAVRLRSLFQVELPINQIFERATVARLAAYLDDLTASGRAGQPEPLPLKPVSRDHPLPLSFAQQRLWFLDQLQPGSPAYNIPFAVRLTGPLNLAALEKSVRELIRRHESLRTTFAMADDRPVQIIAPPETAHNFRISLIQCRPAEITGLLASLARQPFILAQGPLLRLSLLQLAEAEHILLLVMHHLIADGWSLDIFCRELSECYAAYCAGAAPALPELPLQYADFAQWQRQWLTPTNQETQLAYWKEQLGDPLPVLQLPTDRPRPPLQTLRGARQFFSLSQELSEALQSLSRQEGATLFMTLLAAFKALLYRYTGQTDILVGSPVSGRTRLEVEGVVGFFVNTLVIRTDLSGRPTFRELLARVRAACLGAYAHQDTPFEALVEALQPQRDLSRQPLFQVMFDLQPAPVRALQLAGLALEPIPVDNGAAQFDLTLSLEQGEHGLTGLLEYNTDLFEAATIARLAGHYQTLLAGIAAQGGSTRRISDLPLLTPAEGRQLLVEWNQTAMPPPQAKCFHHLFEAQVEQTPQAMALFFYQPDGQSSIQLTYQELNRQANQLAYYLRASGVGPEVRVGLGLERSPEMVVGLLAILKAGGAYVPLDPAYPPERLAFMLADARPAVLLTRHGLVTAPPSFAGQVIYLDSEETRQAIARQRSDNPSSPLNSDNLAYVLYTSGSTGRPKGVQIAHRGLVNMAAQQARVFEVSHNDRVLQFASLSFDASIFEISLALTAGARLYLSTPEVLLPGPALTRLLADQAITVVVLTPSVLAAIPPAPLPALHTVIVAGEAHTAELIARWSAGRRLFNAYGPTEATVWASYSQGRDCDRALPIGRPIGNTQLYLLDAHLNPVPVGVPGELHLAGVGLARGYLNRPDLTAEKFIPHPFSSEPGARLYKTGDLARYLPDGHLEFLGRIDQQVKIRGFRIELGEIEATLAQHPAVSEAAVLVREDTPGDKRLIAYIAPKGGQLQDLPARLRQFLQTRLPGPMLPAAFVLLDKLPLTSNGKLDRAALPPPDRAQARPESAFVGPRNPVEEVLAGLWANLLGLERVGVYDNFFELGGHSLLATQLLAHIQQTFQVELPLPSLFQTPTVAGLAEALVRYETRPGQVAALARLRQKIKGMSEAQIRAMLREKKK